MKTDLGPVDRTLTFARVSKPRQKVWRRFRIRQPLVPAGEILQESNLSNVSLGQPYCQLIVGLGRDHTAEVLVSLDACLAHPEMFEEVEAALAFGRRKAAAG